jgi:hypothetical protein
VGELVVRHRPYGLGAYVRKEKKDFVSLTSISSCWI